MFVDRVSFLKASKIENRTNRWIEMFGVVCVSQVHQIKVVECGCGTQRNHSSIHNRQILAIHRPNLVDRNAFSRQVAHKADYCTKREGLLVKIAPCTYSRHLPTLTAEEGARSNDWCHPRSELLRHWTNLNINARICYTGRKRNGNRIETSI